MLYFLIFKILKLYEFCFKSRLIANTKKCVTIRIISKFKINKQHF